jgi:TolA-binding protein
MPPEQKPSISLPRNQFIALVIGVCVLSAAIGSGLALLAQTGPKGPTGKRGPQGHVGKRGPEGPAGESAGEELGSLEGQVEELRGELEEVRGEAESAGEEEGDVGELESRIEALEEETSGLSGIAEELCSEESFLC